LIRKAKIPDLDEVIHLLYDDGLGRDRESVKWTPSQGQFFS